MVPFCPAAENEPEDTEPCKMCSTDGFTKVNAWKFQPYFYIIYTYIIGFIPEL